MQQIKLILSAVDILKKLQKTPYLLMLRAKGHEPVGIITKMELKYDSGWGVMRTWAKGITLDGNIFEEPLDRKNKKTGDLENLTQAKNDLILVTARNSTDPDDENSDNFQYLLNPHTANEYKDQLDSVGEKDRIIHDLMKRLDEANTKLNMYYGDAESAKSELNSLRERIRNLSERLAEQTQRAEDYKRQLKELQIGLLREESKLDEQMKTTDTLGKLEGKDSADIVIEASKKQAEAMRELSKLEAGKVEAVTKADLQSLKDEIIQSLSKPKEEKEKKET